MIRKFPLFFGRKQFVKFFSGGFIHKVALGWGIHTGDAIQIARNQFFAQEERSIGTFRKTGVSDSFIGSISKTAFAIETDISLEAERATAQCSSFFDGIVQQNFAIALPFQVIGNADGTHGHDGNLAAVIGMDKGPLFP